MSSQINALDMIERMGRYVAFPPALVKPLGGVTAVLFFQQMLYWQDKCADPQLGVYKSADEIESETGLTYREQKTARDKLASLGVLIETHRRLEHRIYFKINRERANEVLTAFFSGDESAIPERRKRNSGTDKSAVPEPTNPQFVEPTKAQFVIQEITQEITTEITSVDLLREAQNNATETQPAIDVVVTEKPSKPKKPAKPKIGIEMPDGIDPQHWEDWLIARKAKGAPPPTQTAWDGILREAAKVRLTPAQAVHVMAESNWQGFNAQWYINKYLNNNTGNSHARPQQPHRESAIERAERKNREFDERERQRMQQRPEIIDIN